jgi:hypothetical protein
MRYCEYIAKPNEYGFGGGGELRCDIAASMADEIDVR